MVSYATKVAEHPDLVAQRIGRKQWWSDRPAAGTGRFGQSRWKALIATAGVRDARLHYARHTAATTLLLLGVSERAVIDIMGWSTGTMTLIYQHVTDGFCKDVAAKVALPS
ncbi:tyrosine-type recombinase/integrase [Micropruina sp.]|uniref:tyrosine-type recombinase/integrase n=1 Tax=Micropruina sp. TaxID=2737536 RepID=UPI0039E573F7